MPIRPSARLDARARVLRRMQVAAMQSAGRGHLPSALSLTEILRVLYDDVLRYRAQEPDWRLRDRFILSKGHGCLALYAILADKGFIPESELASYCAADSRLGGHPETKVPGVETSTGALGHGLAIGVGMALAARLDARTSRVFVVLGDGEINEGSVWESAMSAAKHRLSNLVAIVDYNKLQSYGPTAEVLDLEPLADKWRSFGFAVSEVDGHDLDELRDTFASLPLDQRKPSAVICHTVKGKGIPFIENDARWHHKSKLSADELAALFGALE